MALKILLSRTISMAVLFCPDDKFMVIKEFIQDLKNHISHSFYCSTREHLCTDFKGMKIELTGSEIVLSQQRYFDKQPLSIRASLTEQDQKQLMTNPSLSHGTIARHLIRIPTSASPSCTFSTSFTRQGRKKFLPPLKLTTATLWRAEKNIWANYRLFY